VKLGRHRRVAAPISTTWRSGRARWHPKTSPRWPRGHRRAAATRWA